MLFQGAGKFSREQVRVGSPGGIFNIEFSGDGKVQAAKSKIKIIINTKDQDQNRYIKTQINNGKVLAAACERKSILLFDPLTRCLNESIIPMERNTLISENTHRVPIMCNS